MFVVSLAVVPIPGHTVAQGRSVTSVESGFIFASNG
jgi:hypothetical protein